MIPLAKHNFMHHKYITAKICNGNIYSTVAQTTTERILDTIFCRFLGLDERMNTVDILVSTKLHKINVVQKYSCADNTSKFIWKFSVDTK